MEASSIGKARDWVQTLTDLIKGRPVSEMIEATEIFLVKRRVRRTVASKRLKAVLLENDLILMKPDQFHRFNNVVLTDNRYEMVTETRFAHGFTLLRFQSGKSRVHHAVFTYILGKHY